MILARPENTEATQAASFHEALLYGSDEELLGTVVPFLTEGLAAGEPTVVAWPREREELLREAVPETDGVVFLDEATAYTRLSSVIKAYRSMLADYVAGGASQVRVTGEFPAALLGDAWWWWARYESAANHVYADFPVWTLCTYDTRTAPTRVLDDVTRTHPRLASASGTRSPSASYRPMADFLADHAVTPDPLEAGRPLGDLVDRTPADVRNAVSRAHHAGLLPAGLDVDAAVLVASEAVQNGIRYGITPVRFRLWAGSDRAVIAVHDHGTGPADPGVGLRPRAHHGSGGRGMWLIHELSDHVTLDQGTSGYTLRATFQAPSG